MTKQNNTGRKSTKKSTRQTPPKPRGIGNLLDFPELDEYSIERRPHLSELDALKLVQAKNERAWDPTT